MTDVLQPAPDAHPPAGDATATTTAGLRKVLEIRDLTVDFTTEEGIVHAVDHVSYDVYAGETLGVVGESGSGKSVTWLAAMGLLGRTMATVTGSVMLGGQDLLELSTKSLQPIRGSDIAMIFQDPNTSLNPVMTVGDQIDETIRAHGRASTSTTARARTVQLLDLVGIPDAAQRSRQYPHEFSGGMRQRAMIAMAIANDPKILVADEATTALDVTIQAQVLEILEIARQETHAATILITHDLGLVAELADRIVVMYAGRVSEIGECAEIFRMPTHPYTEGLMGSIPAMGGEPRRLHPIPGQPPSLTNLPSGCAFHPRCARSAGRAICREERPLPVLVAPAHLSACHFWSEMIDGRRAPQAETADA
ncbi:MAG TPA: ABC transporter ATP-binding protein [Candidatus Limnocylindrales bacterium]|jgi:oligopeptide/dipeptide ABC transporter ATP-binding protein|nr:ABC transporter ATP-binding protein [Candidatus Limnocylindrales bacterium]